MREILFRGKQADTGEWVFGDIRHDYNGEPRCISDYFGSNHVDPQTVGQYTGLNDKHGKRIFEGDILHISKIADGLGGYYQHPLDYPVNVVVKWDLCAWMWETLCEDKRYISFQNAWSHYECEIIGNVHDNPELPK